MKLKNFSTIMFALTTSLILSGCSDGDGDDNSGNGFCSDPLPVSGVRDPSAPGYIVQFGETVDAVSETDRLSRLYDFEVGAIYTETIKGFFADMSPIALEQIRCEDTVEAISRDGLVQPAPAVIE